MNQAPDRTDRTIGVFDSGFGGLTVLRALLPLLPGTRFLYLGDTARLPYGSKSRETISRYALSSARFLHEHDADLLVVACNTASALALDDIRAALPIPVIGVIQPGAQAALTASPKDQSPAVSHRLPGPGILVLATTATVQSHAYTRALSALGLTSTEKACPLLVPLVEEDWLSDPAKLAISSEVLRIYLLEALATAPHAHTLLLGCTHYPLLKPLIEQILHTLHHPMTIIDSAEATAIAVASHFPAPALTTPATCEFYATDSVEKFQSLGSAFLGHPLPQVHLIDLGG
ncbi:MAG: glutamate racemase [Acidobacteriaceae bacterium]